MGSYVGSYGYGFFLSLQDFYRLFETKQTAMTSTVWRRSNASAPHVSARLVTPLHAAETHGPPAIDILSSADYADVVSNASSVVSVRSFFSGQGDR